MPRNRDPRVLRVIKVDVASLVDVEYVLQSALPDTLKDNFGQVDLADTQAVTKLIYKPNNFKPGKASKFVDTAKGSVSSYIAKGKGATLKADGWRTSPPKYGQPSSTPLSSIYYATVNGLNIGYRVNDNALPNDFATATGLKLGTPDDIIIMGTAFPQLPTVGYVDPTTGKVKKYACDPTVVSSLPANWKLINRGLFTVTDFKAFFFGG